ncbi:PQQ-binding-like beta-propeller repeat protein [bacterium]|nr:PQQ-binding-like beta-propeller repeat protein [bacterium]
MKHRVSILLLLLLCLPSWACRKITLKQISQVRSFDSNWQLFGGESERNGYRTPTLAPPLEHFWTHKASSAVGPSLLAVDGVLYLATMTGRVEAINILTGKRLGKMNTEGNYDATCAYFQGNLIIASRYGSRTLARYDLRQGGYLWRVDAGDIATEPLILHEGVFISALYSHVGKYDWESGERVWKFETDDQHRSSPALSGNSLIVGCDNGTLYSIEADSGNLNWQMSTGASIFATPVISHQSVFVGSADSNFYAIEREDGKVRWKFHTQAPLYQTSATDGQVVLFGAGDGQFFCLDATTGKERWRFKAASGVSTAPLISGRVVYFGSLDAHYYCLSLADGEELWRFKTRGRVRTSPIIWQNYIFGASEDRYVYAFTRNAQKNSAN